MDVFFLGQITFKNQGSKTIRFAQPLLNAYNLTYTAKIDGASGYTAASGWSGTVQDDIEQASSLVGVAIEQRQGEGYSYYCPGSLPTNQGRDEYEIPYLL